MKKLGDLPEGPFSEAKLTLFTTQNGAETGLQWTGLPHGVYLWQLHDLGGRTLWEQTVQMAGKCWRFLAQKECMS